MSDDHGVDASDGAERDDASDGAERDDASDGAERDDAPDGEGDGVAPDADGDTPGSHEVPDPVADRSPVPAAAMKPLANAVVFVVVWSAMVVYTGRDLVTAVGLGVVGGSIYFLASYYLRS